MRALSNALDPGETEPDAISLDERTLCDDDESRQSSEVSEGDHDILESEDERERLLVKHNAVSGLFGRPKVKIGVKDELSPASNKRQRRTKGGKNGEASALMYDTEEGVGSSETSLGEQSSDFDQQRLPAGRSQRKSRRSQIFRRLAIYVAIIILFVVLLAVAYRLSSTTPKRPLPTMVSNGTSLFAPTTILISLDGFRADFLYRGLTPTLKGFIEEGISPKYMLPSFPSVTFPNHYTMVTGLYPEAHGVVGNSFWDPSLKKEFYYTDPSRSLQPYWWGGEPVWATAERQNVRSAVHMWPGSQAHIGKFEPTYVDNYNGSERLALKVDRIFELLDLPGPHEMANNARPRPQLIAAYVPNVDGDGHKYGPNSTEIRETIRNADAMLGSILQGLHARNLTHIVNVVVVSDHGMATTDVERLIQLEDLIDPEELEHIDGWPLYGLRPKNPKDLERLHRQLVEKTRDNPNVDVYLRDKDMPERYHFSKNERIAPLWIVPKTGWAIVDKSEFNIEEAKKTGEVYHPRGLHGYDFEHPLMRAIFVARGPAFPHKPHSRVEPFQNIELYNIICDSIGIEPAPNNGTLRLPLRPVGLHTDPETPPDETPADPVQSSSYQASTTLGSFASLAASASGMEESPSSAHNIDAAPTPTMSAPPAASSSAEETWWQWFTHKAEHIGEWVENFVHKHVPGDGRIDGDEGAASKPS
ncbi:Phosphodiest-domain-containing protein [Westerdykella ornata]|uniref:Phosphodiest-domain-containing protein n=1 Tax=Westerdykella ornata TaxID=318751 RepID=A0A6A6JMU9_WESOR|nr:Phosphodiest-domain-containing protein [Westerdykella ornata]KAF2277443.1 Phosphodiest-domain-containing protein [Westerdykella ornata]